MSYSPTSLAAAPSNTQPTQPQQATTGLPGQQTSLHTVVSRLSTFIELETEQIQSEQKFDFRASSEKKSRLLFEFNRASRGLDFATLDRSVVNELSRLKQALAKNEARIKAHLSAVREVSDLMVSILRNEDADGTYGEMY